MHLKKKEKKTNKNIHLILKILDAYENLNKYLKNKNKGSFIVEYLCSNSKMLMQFSCSLPVDTCSIKLLW